MRTWLWGWFLAGATLGLAQPAGFSPLTIAGSGPTAPGFIFYNQHHGRGPNNGPVIIDDAGRPVWYRPLASGVAADFRVQTYHGQPVLTWTQGAAFQDAVTGQGVDYICDSAYNVIATVRAGNGLGSDLHEFELTPEGTALIVCYHIVNGDLSGVGGSAHANIVEGVAQEIDVPTGAVLFEWHSLDHVGVDESYASLPASASGTYDYFHINSVKVDTDGNLLISARHTSTVYKVNRKTGAIIWRLGGKKSDFTLGDGARFSYQHNVVPIDATTLRIFDNTTGPRSRVIWIKHDDATMTVTLLRQIIHPDNVFAFAEGSAQDLPNGDTLIDWGTAGRISEFNAQGDLVYDAVMAPGYGSYRAMRTVWTGQPTTNPTVTAVTHHDGTVTLHAIWNGATNVANWQVIGTGSTPATNRTITAPWNGLDTTVTLDAAPDTVRIVALDATGQTLGTSTILTGPFPGAVPTITTQPASQTISAGATVVFAVQADDAVSYQWSLNGTPVSDLAGAGRFISGATTPRLEVKGVIAADAGSYTCTATNADGNTTSAAAVLTLATSGDGDAGRLTNLSCRALVADERSPVIIGFVVGGANAAESLVIRGSGPALGHFGVDDVLPDPWLDLFTLEAPTAPLASVGAQDVTAAVPGTRDITLARALGPGAYTANIRSTSGASGVALAEIDEAAGAGGGVAGARLLNGSGRATVGVGGNLLIAGFVIGGSTSRTVLIRAAGPALAAYGVSGVLAHPQLQLFSSAGEVLAANEGWAGDPQIAAAAARVSAFPWTDASSKDAALLITLPPGAYTAQISGADEETGTALVEVYDVD